MSMHLWVAASLVSPYRKSLKRASVRRRMETSRL